MAKQELVNCDFCGKKFSYEKGVVISQNFLKIKCDDGSEIMLDVHIFGNVNIEDICLECLFKQIQYHLNTYGSK